MKKTYYYCFMLALIVLTSCTSTKEILMFQKSNDEKIAQISIPEEQPEHRIKPNDNLFISIKTLDPEVNGIFNPSGGTGNLNAGTLQMFGSPAGLYLNGFRVSSDSTIVLPILGKINFVGLTLQQAHERLEMKADEYLKDPLVQIKFLNFKVNMLGEIKNPGVLYNYEGSLNVLDAIGLANGITDFADLKNVVVKREGDNNKIYTHNINLTDNSVYKSEAYYLKPNDLVYIPPSNLKRRNVNSDAYAKILGTLSTLMVAVAFFRTF